MKPNELLQLGRQRWEHLSTRVDAMSLRERAITFVALAALLVLCMDSWFYEPLAKERRLLKDIQDKQTATLQQLRQQLQEASAQSLGDSKSAQQRRQLLALQEQLEAQQQRLHQALGKHGGLPQLQLLLQSLLTRHDSLHLLRLDTLKERKDLQLRSADAASAVGADLHWQGVELEVSGDYAALQSYLSGLEQKLPGLHWGQLQLRREGDTTVMQVQIFVLGSVS